MCAPKGIRLPRSIPQGCRWSSPAKALAEISARGEAPHTGLAPPVICCMQSGEAAQARCVGHLCERQEPFLLGRTEAMGKRRSNPARGRGCARACQSTLDGSNRAPESSVTSGRGKHRTPRRTARAAASLPHGCARGAVGSSAPRAAPRPRTKGEAPPQRIDEQTQIAGVADDPIDGGAMKAILYLLRTGCPWRYLPRFARDYSLFVFV